MTDLRARGLRAAYGPQEVLRGVDLVVESGQVAAVLGPSGCGKTTLLRVLAGHHRALAGEVHAGGRLLASESVHLAPERRSVTVVPQEGALFPHLDVRGNVAFGLRGRADRGRVEELLDLVGLADLGARRPAELSGGQQQRVAVARALAPRPDYVLLDEPFSALDAHLRQQLRADVRRVLLAEHCTAVLVTHDQDEAMTFADTVAVMREGVIAQQGSPTEVYAHPADERVARFLGDAVILHVDPEDPSSTPFGTVEVSGRGDRMLLRPEQVHLHDDGVPATVEDVEFHGAYSMVMVRLTGAAPDTWRIRVGGLPPRVGAEVRLVVAGGGWLLDA